MNLLLTNDDGFMAEGIRVLAKNLCKEHNIYVVAPDRNRSASSHRITVDKPIRLRKEDCINESSVNDKSIVVYSCSGAPADCVLATMRTNFLGVKIDAVVSGINRGINIGTDIIYSGTCAAARQAVLHGVPGIAVSLSSHTNSFKYDALARFTLKNFQKLYSLASITKNPHEQIFVNINASSLEEYKAVRFANELSVRKYNDTCKLVEDFYGDNYSFFQGNSIITEGSPTSDYTLCEDGFVSISCVYAEPACVKNVDISDFSL